MKKDPDRAAICAAMKQELPNALAFYLSGSSATESMRADSDIDLAFLTTDKPDPAVILSIKASLGELLKRDADLIDLGRAPPRIEADSSNVLAPGAER